LQLVLQDDSNLLTYIRKKIPHFDARIFNVPSDFELLNNVKWRHLFDYRRNSISGLAQKHFRAKDLQRLHSGQLIEKLLQEKGIDWHAMPEWYKWGAFVKFQKYQALVWVSEKDGPKQLEVTKHKTITIIRELEKKYSLDDEQFVTSQFYDAETNAFPIFEMPLLYRKEEKDNEDEEENKETSEEPVDFIDFVDDL